VTLFQRTLGLASACLLLASGAAAQDRTAADEIIALEKAFETRAAEIGLVPAFRQYAAPDAIMFLPGPMPAGPYLEQADWPGVIVWRPRMVSVAPSGDMAVSLGPSLWTVEDRKDPGYYLSIWSRQADGAWRFVLDRGTPGAPDYYSRPAEPVTVVDPVTGGGPPATPEALEIELGRALADDARGGLLRRLDPEAWIVRSGHGAETGRAASARIADDPDRMTIKPLGGGVSRGGDFLWTYGLSEWQRDGRPVKGQYVRVWRRGLMGWRILVDHQVTLPEPAADQR
jgi:ketosteroid isomerase-like protein